MSRFGACLSRSNARPLRQAQQPPPEIMANRAEDEFGGPVVLGWDRNTAANSNVLIKYTLALSRALGYGSVRTSAGKPAD
jgi:hypothetical protein